MKFNFVFLGQSVLRYEVPLDIFNAINRIYENNFRELPAANRQLVGKIMDEKSIFYDGDDETKMKRFSLLPANVHQWFLSMYNH